MIPQRNDTAQKTQVVLGGGQRIAFEARPAQNKCLAPQKLTGLTITRFQRDADVPTPAAAEAQMFRNATSFNQPLNNWNVSNDVKDMEGMFWIG